MGNRYLRPDTNEIVEVLPGLNNNWIAGVRKPNGSVKRLKTQRIPPCEVREVCQEWLDLYVEMDRNGKWPVVEETDKLVAAKAARKKWKAGDLVWIRDRGQYDGYQGRIFSVPPAKHPQWRYNVTLLDTSQEHDCVDCVYDEMELVEETDMAKKTTARAVAKTRPAEKQEVAVAKPVDTWNYGGVPAVDARRCRAAYETIVKHQRNMAGNIIAVGKELIAVKARLEHGQFGDWIKHHFEWSARTAQGMMQAAEVFGKCENFAHLSIDTSALYLLSSDSCPDELREDILERAGSGELITHATVKDKIRQFAGDDDEDEPAPASNGKQRRAADPPAAADTEAVDLYDAEPAEWSLPAFIYSVRREVNQWVAVCPEDEREEIAQVLRDLAAQVEGGNQ